MDSVRAAQLVKISIFRVSLSVTSASSSGSVGPHSVSLCFMTERLTKEFLGTRSQSAAKPSQLRGLSPPKDGGRGGGKPRGWGRVLVVMVGRGSLLNLHNPSNDLLSP